jgi:hypothetical protein
MEKRPPIWRVPSNILNKQSRIADKGWSSSLGVGRGVKIEYFLSILVPSIYLDFYFHSSQAAAYVRRARTDKMPDKEQSSVIRFFRFRQFAVI